MAKTRLGLKGVGVRPYAGFSPKTPSSGPKGSSKVTRLLSIGIGGKKRRTGKGIGPFTRLTTMAINGRRVIFEAKNPIIPPVELVVTRLLSFGIGGKRVSFEPKTPAVSATTLGGAKTVRGKKLTEEQLKALDLFGRIQQGQYKPEITEEITIPEIHEISILEDSQEAIELHESPLVQLRQERQVETYEQTVQDRIRDEEDIGLILAILEAHFN